MNRCVKRSVLLAAFAIALRGTAANAVLVVDQTQPFENNTYSAASRFTFQQSVTAGLAGKLAGFTLTSNQVGTANVYINRGPAWQSDAHDWVGTLTSAGVGPDFVDVSFANIMLIPGDQFVIGFNGANVLAVQGLWAPQPADAYPGGGVYTHDSVLNTFTGPFGVIGPTTFNTDLTFTTFLDVAAVPEARAWMTLGVVGAGTAAAIFLRRIRSRIGPPDVAKNSC